MHALRNSVTVHCKGNEWGTVEWTGSGRAVASTAVNLLVP